MNAARKTTGTPMTRKATETRNAPQAAAQPQDTCSVDGCTKDVHALGLCGGHFASRRGDGTKPTKEVNGG